MENIEKKLDNREIIALLDVYLKECIHRDSSMWSYTILFLFLIVVNILMILYSS